MVAVEGAGGGSAINVLLVRDPKKDDDDAVVEELVVTALAVAIFLLTHAENVEKGLVVAFAPPSAAAPTPGVDGAALTLF